MSLIDNILDRLDNVKTTGAKSWQARCPNHEDRTASLSLKEGDDGRVLIKCFAGCETSDVVKAAGLEMKDLFEPRDPDWKPSPNRQPSPPKAYKDRTPVHLPALESKDIQSLEASKRLLADRWPVPELVARGFTLETAQQCGLALATNGNTLIPMIDPERRIVAIQCRHATHDVIPRYTWLKNGAGLPAICSPNYGASKTVLIVEGGLSGMIAWTALRHVGLEFDVQGISGTGGKMYTDALKGLDVLMYGDGDEPGKKALQKWSKIALEAGAKSVKFLAPLPYPQDFCDIAGTEGIAALAVKIKGLIEDADQWPEPEPYSDILPSVPALNPKLVPEKLRAYCQNAAADLSVPFEFLAVPALAAIGGFIGRRVGLRLKRHARWTCFGNLYVVIIGNPSAGKTPTLQAATRFLESNEDEKARQFKVESRAAKARKMMAESKLAELKSAASKTSKDLSDEARFAQMTALLEEIENSAIPQTRLIVNDVTDAKLVDILQNNPRGIIPTFIRDEITKFFEQLEDSEHVSKPFYLELFSGDARHTHDRKGDGTIRVQGAGLSIIGGIQPAKLRPYVAESFRHGSSDGFFARFLPVWPDRFGDYVFSDREDPKEIAKQMHNLYRFVDGADWLKFGATEDPGETDGFEVPEDGDAPPKKPPFFKLSDEAYAMFVEFYTEQMRSMRRDDDGIPEDEFIGKTGKHLGSIALILHILRLESGEIEAGPVDATTITMAIGWLKFFTGHWGKILGLAKHTSPGAILADRIRNTKKLEGVTDLMTVRDLERKKWSGLRTTAMVQQALDELTESGWIKLENISEGNKPSWAIRLNPKLGASNG